MKVSSDCDQKRKVVSQSELARHLGLSDGTVSRALNGHPMVKESTRKRVLQAMEEIGFQADPLARGLRGKQTGMIGIVCNELLHSILLEKLASFEDFLREHGLRSLLVSTGKDQRNEVRAIADFRRLRVDAVVLIQSMLPAAVSGKELADMKCVHVDPYTPQPGVSVSVDRNKGMEFLIDHLVELGHRSFGLLGVLEINVWRWPGLLKALARHGIDPKRSLKVYQLPEVRRFSYETGVHLAEQVLADRKPPTALLAINDVVALAAAQHLIWKGISIPGQFSVTGFDHLELSKHMHPTLTTIDHEPHSLIEAVGKLLLEQLSGNASVAGSIQRVIEPRMMIGESTGPAIASGSGRRRIRKR